MVNNVVLNEWFAHEALDRTYLSLDQFEEYVAKHPFIDQTPHLKEQAEKVISVMHDMYQMIGTESFKNYENKN